MERKITTSYSFNKHTIRSNKATYPLNAVLRCVDHMQRNTYGANLAEVYSEDGKLYCVVTRPIAARRIVIQYKNL